MWNNNAQDESDGGIFIKSKNLIRLEQIAIYG
jgi:hypothetical protein